jgi:hypothetical protein
MALIFRAKRTLPDGTVLWARDYGLKAWPIEVPDSDLEDSTDPGSNSQDSAD